MENPTLAQLRRITELAAKRLSSEEIAAVTGLELARVERALGHRGMAEGLPTTAAMESIDSNRAVVKQLHKLARTAETDKDAIAALTAIVRANAATIAAARFLHQAGLKAKPTDSLPPLEQADMDFNTGLDDLPDTQP